MMRGVRSFLVVAMGALMTACAGAPKRTTWDQDRAEGIPVFGRSAPLAPRPVKKRKARTIDTRRPERNDAVVAANLEMSIIQFTTKRRALSQRNPKRGRTWPVSVRHIWQDLLTTLEKSLRMPRGRLPRRVLIQSRVTLEAELELTERSFGPAPDDVRQRTQVIYVRVAEHMRSAPPPGQAPSHHVVRFAWPVSPLVVTSPFGYRRDPILGETSVRFHAGVDLGGQNGDIVVAAGPGRVVGAGWLGGHGRTVTVQHAGGYITMYAHLKRIMVKQGARVDMGTPVGLMGSTGRSTGPHLHFEVRQGGVPIDPLEVISGLGNPLAVSR